MKKEYTKLDMERMYYLGLLQGAQELKKISEVINEAREQKLIDRAFDFIEEINISNNPLNQNGE